MTNKRTLDALKAKIRRCVLVWEASKKLDANALFGRVPQGRGHAEGWRTTRVPDRQRKRLRGAGRRALGPEIGFTLYQWLVDTVHNLCSRLSRTMVTEKAKCIAAQVSVKYEADGASRTAAKDNFELGLWHSQGMGGYFPCDHYPIQTGDDESVPTHSSLLQKFVA